MTKKRKLHRKKTGNDIDDKTLVEITDDDDEGEMVSYSGVISQKEYEKQP